MNHHKIAVRYSKAIFLLAKEKNVLDDVKNDILLINKVCTEIKDIKRMLSTPTIQTSKKQKIFELIFKDKISSMAISFLNIITKNKREIFIPDIVRNFMEFYRKDKGIKYAVLTTATDANDNIKNSFVRILKQLYNSEIELTTNVNKDIIGGFVLTVEDKQVDTSVANQLKEIKREFINTSFEYKILG